MSKRELILAVNAAVINDRATRDGKRKSNYLHSYSDDLFGDLEQHLAIKPRYVLEEDPNFRQFISYSVLYEPNTRKILLYQRTKSGPEGKLHGKHSIGWGGHVDISSVEVDDDKAIELHPTLMNTIIRELQEEAGFNQYRGDDEIKIDHVIISNDGDVDKKHIALVSLIPISWNQRLAFKEGHCEPLGWYTVSDILKGPSDLESWSQKLLDYLELDPFWNELD